jgi:predicted transglutaminase-like cysteine proteinase
MSTLRLWTFALIATAVLSTVTTARASLNSAPIAAPYNSATVFHRDTAVFPQWTDVMQRAARELRRQRVCASADDGACVPAEWRSLIDDLAGLPLMAKLETVNRAFNALPYVTAWQNWHRPMYWETPFELLARGGQCEDYAIAKYLALRWAGVGDNAMRVLICATPISALTTPCWRSMSPARRISSTISIHASGPSPRYVNIGPITRST